MGVNYTVILYDEFDWAYVGKTKQSTLRELQLQFEAIKRPAPTLIVEWYGFMVLNFWKLHPEEKVNSHLLNKYSDVVYYCGDNAPGNLIKLDILSRPSVDESKKASSGPA